MTRVILIRHGEAVGNIRRVFQGHTDSEISPNGRVQLDLLRLRCRNMQIDAIYSSPLKRAYQTAQAVNSFRNLPVQMHEDLIEINGGDWEGRSFRELPELYPQDALLWNTRPQDFAPKNGEPMRHVYARMQRAVLEIVKENLEKTICITSHGCAIRNFLCWAMGKPIEEINDVDWCDNTAVSLIEFDTALNPTVVLANDASHLTQETSTLAKQGWWRPEHRSKTEWDEEMLK